MPLSRKDLLMDGSSSTPPLSDDEKSKLRNVVVDSNEFASLAEHPGWKKLIRDFIEPRLSSSVFLAAKKDELCCVQSRQRVLTDLLVFVNSKIKDGEKAYEKLNTSTNRR